MAALITTTLLILCTLFFLYLAYKYAVYRPKGFPPGPPRMPIFGSYLLMMLTDYKYLHKAVLKFSKWFHSDIVGFYVGSAPFVAVHSAAGVREVLNNSDFDGRGEFFIAKMRDPRTQISGIFFVDGPFWHEQRRFILRYLRDSGFGRRFDELESIMKEELSDLLDMIRNGPQYEHEHAVVKPQGYRIQLPTILNIPSANSVFYIIRKERYARSEQAELVELVQLGMQFQRNADDYGKMLGVIPWVRHIFPNWSAYNKLMEANIFIYKFFAKFIDRHIDSYEEEHNRNFLDLYIKEIKLGESSKEESPKSTFDREQFIMALIDFSFPAFSAIGTQTSFFIQYMLLYPAACKRIQAEIDEVVGNGRLPCLDDRKDLHYTEASIREVLRMETLVPSDVPHMTMVDTELLGYKIPKGTNIIPSLYAYHCDQRVWGDPEIFRPERFLDDNGHLCLKKDVSFPFGAGKRLCAGETFARNMLFLLTTTLCQNFNFVLAPGDAPPDLSKTLSGLIISPPDFWVQLSERDSI